MRWGNLQTSKY